MTIHLPTLLAITGFTVYFFIREMIANSELKEQNRVLEQDVETLEYKVDNLSRGFTDLNISYTQLYEKHDDFLGKMVDEATKRTRTVYYVPRLNKIVEYKELVDLGEL